MLRNHRYGLEGVQIVVYRFSSFYNKMESSLKNICSLISEVVALDETVVRSRLSFAEVKALLSFVDVKGKGYLDLGDVFELVGKVAEEELFGVFKFLDRSRTGEIRLVDMEKALGDQNSTSDQKGKEYIFPKFYSIIDTVKDRPKAIVQARQKLGLSQQQLKEVYKYMCELVQSKYLANGQFVTVLKAQSMKYGWIWGSAHEGVVAELLGGQGITEARFVECFGKMAAFCREETDEENLLSGIQQSYSRVPEPRQAEQKQVPRQAQPKQAERVVSPPLTHIPAQHQLRGQKDTTSNSIIYKKTNNFVQEPLDTPSFRRQSEAQQMPSQLDYSKGRKEMDKIEGNINDVLGAIQQRREKLRHDSMERKKIIEDVMSRKKDLCRMDRSMVASPKESYERSRWNRQDCGSSAMKPQYKSYGNLGQAVRESSVPKEPVYPEYQRREPMGPYPFVSEFKPARDSYEHSSHASPRKYSKKAVQIESYGAYEPKSRARPSTPTAYPIQEMNIEDILKKYNQNKEIRIEDPDAGTLKQLCKSKSGVLYNQAPGAYRPHVSSKYAADTSEPWENKWHREESGYGARMRPASKQNVMKRAQEEAAKKIDEIERKARMKVLEKKNILSRNEGRDWRGLAKKGNYY